jgi:thioredoxin 1
MSNTLKFTDESFEEDVINADSDQPVLVDFWAEWCGPCRMVGPVVDELADEFEGQAKIGKVDVDSNSETSTKYGIRSIPALLIFKDGEVVDQIVGAVPKAQLKKKLEDQL